MINEFMPEMDDSIRQYLSEGLSIRHDFYEMTRTGHVSALQLNTIADRIKELSGSDVYRYNKKLNCYLTELTCEICDVLDDRIAQKFFLNKLGMVTPFVWFESWQQGVQILKYPPKEYGQFFNRERYVVIQHANQNRLPDSVLGIVDSYLEDFQPTYVPDIAFFQRLQQLMDSDLLRGGPQWYLRGTSMDEFSVDLHERIQQISARMPLNPFKKKKHPDALLLAVLQKIDRLKDRLDYRFDDRISRGWRRDSD